MTVNCRNCSFFLGSNDKFGFLEAPGFKGFGTSYHLVLHADKADSFTEEVADVIDEVIKPDDSDGCSYQIMNCRNCGIDIGKRMYQYGATYLAFGKEKVTIDGSHLEKSDKWVPHLKDMPYSELQRFSVENFGGVPTVVRSRSQPNWQRNNALPDRNKFAPGKVEYKSRNPAVTTPSYGKSKVHSAAKASNYAPGNYTQKIPGRVNVSNRDAPSYHTQKLPDRVNAPDIISGQGSKSHREDVGKSIKDKVEFLRKKTNFWDVNKLIHELTGNYLK